MMKRYDPLLYRVRRYVAGQSEQAAAAGQEETIMEDDVDALDPQLEPAPAPIAEPPPAPVEQPAPRLSPEAPEPAPPNSSDIKTLPAPENSGSDASIVPAEKGALAWFLRR